LDLFKKLISDESPKGKRMLNRLIQMIKAKRVEDGIYKIMEEREKGLRK